MLGELFSANIESEKKKVRCVSGRCREKFVLNLPWLVQNLPTHNLLINTIICIYCAAITNTTSLETHKMLIFNLCLFLFTSSPLLAVDGSSPIYDSKTMPARISSGQPLITSPTSVGSGSSTLTPGGSGISFNERFKPAQNGATAESLYSLATESGVEVKRQLKGAGGSGDLPAGIPLSEALASKGLGNGASRAATMDPGFVYPMSGLSDYNFFSPRPPGVNDPQGIYSLAQQESHPKAARSATLMPGAQLDQKETQQYGAGGHRPLQMTSSLGGGRGSQSQSPSNSAGPTASSAAAMGGVRAETNRAELLENGYMAPRRIPRPSGYEYPPFGPPRPAGDQTVIGSSSSSSGTGTPTSRQPHSALLLRPEAEKVSSPSSTAAAASGRGTGRSPTYINVQGLDGSAPPPIDRTTKPTPPAIDRTLKPVGYQSPKNTPPEYEGGELDEEEDGDSDSSDSSPEMSKKHASSSGVPFSIADLPKPTNRTTQYTQVEIVSGTNRLKISSPAADDDNVSRRAPIPIPRDRDRDHPVPKPRRVNYSDIDLTATAARVEARTTSRSPTLRHAERDHLKDTPYINVNREGEVDDDTDPDYYTHMRVSGEI